MVSADIILIPFSLWISLSIRYGDWYHNFENSWVLFIALPLFTIPIFIQMGLYRAVLRYVGIQAFQQIAKVAFHFCRLPILSKSQGHLLL